MDRRVLVARVRRLLDGGESVLLVAPAGFGKTETARTVAGTRPALWARARAGSAATPYAALAEALGTSLGGAVEDVAIEVLAATERRLLVVEDLHWCDPATLAVLDSVAATRPVLMTSRESVLLPASELAVAPLSAKAAHGLLRRLRPDLPAGRRGVVVAAAGGSPLLLRVLADDDSPAPSLRGMVARRLSSLDHRSRLALAAVALSGGPTRRQPPAGARTMLVQHLDRRWWFAHDAIADEVRDSLTPTFRRQALLWLLGVAAEVDRPHLLTLLGRHAEAAELAERLIPTVTRQRRVPLLAVACRARGEAASSELLAQYADALLDVGRTGDAARRARLALDRAEHPADRARAHLMAGRAAYQHADADGAQREVRAGLAHAAEGSPEQARLAVELATVLVRERPLDPATDAAVETALAAADRAGVDRAKARNAHGLLLSLRGRDGWSRRFADAELIAKLAGDEEQECAAAYSRASAYGLHGPNELVRPLVDRMLVRTRELGLVRWHQHFLGLWVSAVGQHGWFRDEDLRVMERMLAADPGFRNRAQVEAVLVLALADRGELVASRAALDRALARARHDEDRSLALMGAAELCLATGDVAAMASVVEQFLALERHWLIAGAFVESAAVQLWLAERAAGRATPPLPPIPWPRLPGVLPIAATREALDLVDRDPAAAADLLEDAATQLGAASRTRLERRARLGAAYAATAGGDLARARDLAGSLARSEVPGRTDLSVRGAVQMAQRLAVEAWRDSLSTAQRAVMGHVARGLSTRQIAVELGVAPSTVETHVRTVLERTGCSSRAQAAALLVGREEEGAVELPTRLHDALVRQLAAGHTLADAADSLGMSLRTAARRLAEARAAAGVGTTQELLVRFA